MKTPNSNNALSIPDTAKSVNGLTEQSAIQVCGYGLIFDEQCTEEMLFKVSDDLIEAENKAIVFYRFCKGDAYNELVFHKGTQRASIIERYSEQYYNFLRMCGWVASKWPHNLRTGKRSWNYYKTNEPGTTPTNRIYAVHRLKHLSSEQIPEGELLRCASPDGREWTLLIDEEKRLREERAVYSVKGS